ncbi:MAG: RNA methyltransferase, partial [Thermodesulfobacteriota bacterium]|nr:RNA methyltransferase [Thermodesulfobacteriota bacterium]
SALEESFSQGLLEYPHYTRPEVYKDMKVPEILTSGDHAKIASWRKEKALAKTLEARPKMLEHAKLTQKDANFLRGCPRMGLSRNLYPVLIHHPVLNKRGETVAVSLTNLDVHDIARVSRTFRLGGYFIATPLEDQRLLAEKLLTHWLDGPGAETNPDRTEALSVVRVRTGLEEIKKEVEAETGVAPRLVAATASGAGTMELETVREWLKDFPVLLVLGTGSGLAPEIMDQVHGVLRPIRFLDAYNHLSVRSAAAVLVDRVLGDWY